MTQKPFLYLRGLRNVDFTVFAVADGQKRYWDALYRQEMPFASGQQVKRSLLECMMAELGQSLAPVDFRKKLDDAGKASDYIAVQTLDPSYPDQLIGGWMRATDADNEKKAKKKKEKEQEDAAENEPAAEPQSDNVIKRRSPLSVSAMRPLHPLLAGVVREGAMTFDRRGQASAKVSLRDATGRLLNDEEVKEFLNSTDKPVRPMMFLGKAPKERATGLFIYDIAIDLRRLFTVSLDPADPELKRGLADELRSKGWKENRNAFGPCLICPKERRDEIIPALAHALINWDITSNQSTKYHPREVLAIAISQNANHIVNAIRADLDDSGESTKARAIPRVDKEAGAQVFVAPVASGKGLGIEGSGNALDEAQAHIQEILETFPYGA